MTSGRVRAAVCRGARACLLLLPIGLGTRATASTDITAPASAARSDASDAPGNAQDSVDLSDSQLGMVKVEPVEEREFPVEKEAIGNIGFNEEMSVQVFTPYQGRIIALFASVGDDVQTRSDAVYDRQPRSAASGIDLDCRGGRSGADTSEILQRLRDLYTTRAVSAARCRAGGLRSADRRRQSAGGARRGAPVRQDRRRYRPHHRATQRDPTLVVPSPIAGRITARNAAPGPVRAARQRAGAVYGGRYRHDVDAGECRRGRQPGISCGTAGAGQRSMRLPGRVFDGKITTIGATVDPNTRAFWSRSEIKDPQHELRSGMFASFRHQHR